jgi:uncharacterized protein YcgI (DUF1989 family)
MAVRSVTLSLNQQQLDLINRSVAQGVAENVVALIHRALREHNSPVMASMSAAPAIDLDVGSPVDERTLIFEHIMQPGTGKALEVRAGQILRIEQTKGAQCVDFNCFNLNDYKEAMHVGRMRAMYGLLPTKGDFIWSAPPRERAMMYILEDTARCNDVMFSRCNAYLYESGYGFASHTNCHDIQAEAQREYGLTPDDVHDSFNMFMCTEVRDGRLQINRQHAGPHDHVELLALMDVLAVPNVCGNDVGRSSNFSLKPIRLSILGASQLDLRNVPQLKRHPASQRTPASFRQSRIKADRPLTREAGYVADFANVPLKEILIQVELGPKEQELLKQTNLQEYYGDDDGAMLRDVVLSWWERHFTAQLPGTST